MNTFLRPDSAFIRNSAYGLGPSTPLKQAIMSRVNGTIDYSGGEPVIRAGFHGLADAVESAFVLVPREALPKVTPMSDTMTMRRFSLAHDPLTPHHAPRNATAEQARKTAANWLAIAGHLEAEEKAAAAEAKKKADAEAVAKNARNKRISELAYEYFDTAVEELGTRKTRVIEEVYRLEEDLAEAKDCCGCDD